MDAEETLGVSAWIFPASEKSVSSDTTMTPGVPSRTSRKLSAKNSMISTARSRCTATHWLAELRPSERNKQPEGAGGNQQADHPSGERAPPREPETEEGAGRDK